MIRGVRPRPRGQALIIIVFAIMGLVGITALAVDGGSAYADRRRAQNAADTAALSGALARIRGENWEAAAAASAAQNGYDNNGTSNTVEVFSPPTSGPHNGDVEYIQVRITSHVTTYFARVIGMQQINNVVEAVSRTKTPEYMQMFDGAAIVSLAPKSDCGPHKAFYVGGEATLDITGSGIFVNSDNSKCALMTEGNGSVRIKDGQIEVVGTAYIKKPKLITPYPPQEGALQQSYPPPYFMPKVGCGKAAEISPDGKTLSAGWWDEDFPPDGVTHLAGGVYCVNGDFDLQGKSLDGSGVTIKLEHGELRFNGSSEFSLTAPSTGELAGLLIYSPIENKSKIVLNGNANSKMVGTILAPGATIHINGNDNGSGWKSQIIGYMIDVNGDSKIVLVYRDEQNYDALSMPELQFTQ